jgi:hypothetical protein
MKLPVDFSEKAKAAKQVSGGGYPVQLSAADLMKNFKYSAGDFEAESFTVTESGDTRNIDLKLKIPALPGSGTHVLGAVDGVLQWIATEEC